MRSWPWLPGCELSTPLSWGRPQPGRGSKPEILTKLLLPSRINKYRLKNSQLKYSRPEDTGKHRKERNSTKMHKTTKLQQHLGSMRRIKKEMAQLQKKKRKRKRKRKKEKKTCQSCNCPHNPSYSKGLKTTPANHLSWPRLIRRERVIVWVCIVTFSNSGIITYLYQSGEKTFKS